MHHGEAMRRAFATSLAFAAILSGCGSGGCDDCDEGAPQPAVTAVQWHLGAPNADWLAYSASSGPDYVYLYVTVTRSDGSSTTERAVGNCSSRQQCEFKPGDLLGVGPQVAYKIQLSGDINAAHLSGNNVVPAPPPGAYPYAILLDVDQGNDPPFQTVVEVQTDGFAPVTWVVSVGL